MLPERFELLGQFFGPAQGGAVAAVYFIRLDSASVPGGCTTRTRAPLFLAGGHFRRHGQMRACMLKPDFQNIEGDPRRQAVPPAELERIDPDLVAFQEVVDTANRGIASAMCSSVGSGSSARYCRIQSATIVFERQSAACTSDHFGVLVVWLGKT